MAIADHPEECHLLPAPVTIEDDMKNRDFSNFKIDIFEINCKILTSGE